MSFPLPNLGLIKEYSILAVGSWSDSDGTYYELHTQEGPKILAGRVKGEACVQVEGFEQYGGPHAERVLQAAREMFREAHGVDPEA